MEVSATSQCGHFTPVKRASEPLDRRLGRAPGPIWMWWQREKFPAPARNQILVIHPKA